MSLSIYRQGSDISYNIIEFIADTNDDLELAPKTVSPGSTVFIVNTSQTYMLNTNKEWILVSTGGSGEGGTVISISNVYIRDDNHLIVVLTNGAEIDAGALPTVNITIINGGNAEQF